MTNAADQYFNLMSGLADSVMDMTDEEVLEETEPYQMPEKRCNYLCGPHLDQCALERGHRKNCLCVRDDNLVTCITARALLMANWNESQRVEETT